MKIAMAVLALLTLSACAKSESYELAELRYHTAMERWCQPVPTSAPCIRYHPTP